jgi:subtilisin family serine protease
MRRVILLVALALFAISASAQQRQGVLIKAPKPYDNLVNTIEQLGGAVTYKYKYVDGLAAEVPTAALPILEKIVGTDNIGKDDLLAIPGHSDPRGGEATGTEEAESVAEASADISAMAQAHPNNYVYTGGMTGASSLHAQGFTGSGIIVAVIDSGIRPLFPHLAGRVISPGLNLVPASSEPGGVAVPAIDNANFPHGTQSAGMVAAAVNFCFGAPGVSRIATLAAAFGAGFPGMAPCSPTQTLIPMIGTAPGALIFPIKVFPTNGASTPTSRTIAAMEAAISLRQLYEAGDPAGLNIQVVNLSLGGATTAAGRTLSDMTVEKLIENDIVPVISMGNDGFSTMTGGSPGTSMAALTVGAASTAQHEWIFRGNFSAPCNTIAIGSVVACALAWRPDPNMQMAEFSSRGPTHDGRPDPDVIANGFASHTQGSGSTAGTVNFASGTSFSAPSVAGVAAILRHAYPTGTAKQIRNAIMMGADPTQVPTATDVDQGMGFVNAAAALALLQGGGVPDSFQTYNFTRNVQANMARAGRKVYNGPVSRTMSLIRPGETAEIAYDVPPDTETLVVQITNIVPELPPAQQNIFFTDDVFLRIQSARVQRRDRRVSTFLQAGAGQIFTFQRPEAGIWRITPTGDWINAGRITFDVNVFTVGGPSPQMTAKDDVSQGDLHVYTVNVPSGVASLDVRLEWLNMWGNYAVNDVDAILIDPSGAVNNNCNTQNAPERCTVANPMAGTWTVLVNGFSINPIGTPDGREKYTLRVAADGNVLQPN